MIKYFKNKNTNYNLFSFYPEKEMHVLGFGLPLIAIKRNTNDNCGHLSLCKAYCFVWSQGFYWRDIKAGSLVFWIESHFDTHLLV